MKRDLLTEVTDLLRPFIDFTNLSNETLVQLLLYGDSDLPNDVNRTILELTLCFVYENRPFWLIFGI